MLKVTLDIFFPKGYNKPSYFVAYKMLGAKKKLQCLPYFYLLLKHLVWTMPETGY